MALLFKELFFMLQQTASVPAPIREHASTEWFPVAFEQQLLLDHSEEKPAEQYNIVYGYRVKGAFRAELFMHAVAAVRKAHDALRTVFCVRDSVHHQKILNAEAACASCEIFSWAGSEAQFFERAASTPLDLEKGPLFSCGLCRTADSWLLYVRWHHAIVDAWSVGLVTRQLHETYDALVGAKAVEILCGPPVADVIREEIDGAKNQPDAGQYWAQQAEGAKPGRLLDNTTVTGTGAAHAVVRHLQLAEADLENLLKTRRLSPAMLFVAAAAAAAARNDSWAPIVIPTILATRDRPALKSYVGVLMRLVLLRLDTHAQMSGEELLRWVRTKVLAAWAHRREPLGLSIERYPSVVEAMGEMPLPLLVQLLDVPDRIFTLSGCETTEVFHGFRSYTRFQAELQIRPRQGGIFDAALVFDRSLGSVLQMNQVMDQYARIVDALLRYPQRSLGAITGSTG